jgi:glyoxylase-like metal-dependent hydrolase (beta-lactamase superfamily II)
VPTVGIGDITIVPLVQLRRAMPPQRLFDQIDPDAPRDGWYWRDPYVTPSGDLVLDMGGFLVRTPTATLLVDCGVGNGKNRAVEAFHHRADDWFGRLRSAGVERADVDLVVFTHLHGDHVGYATTLRDGRWEPSFPNARHLVTAAELEFWTGPGAAGQLARIGDHVADGVRPLLDAGVLDLVPPDHEVAAGVRLVAAAGHTPGNVCVEVRSGGDRALFCGDMVHHAIQLAYPEWSTTFCVDRPAATAARRRLLADAAGSGALLVPAHFPGCLPGRVTRSGDAYRWAPVTG